MSKSKQPNESDEHVTTRAERIRAACIAAATEAHEDALIRGLCAEGAWEAAIHAMHDVDLDAIVSDTVSDHCHPSPHTSLQQRQRPANRR